MLTMITNAADGTPWEAITMAADLRITFPDVSAAARSRLASDLRDTLLQVKGVSSLSVLRERRDTQDAGSIVSLVLAAPAVVMAVKALGAWLVREHASVTIALPDGTIILNGMKSRDVSKAIEALNPFVK
jgi:hypothetical protein